MTDLIVRSKTRLDGTIKAPSSKSITHRAVIAASLSKGRSQIKNVLMCDDTIATINACIKLGVQIQITKGTTLIIRGKIKLVAPLGVINCGESASTMRFLAPVCATADGITVLTGQESLSKRPMGPALNALGQLGVKCYSGKGDGFPPFTIHGQGIKGGDVFIPGDISSQFISGLLFATPLAINDTSIFLSTPLESKPYVNLTLQVLKNYGIEVEVEPDYSNFRVPCKQKYKPYDYIVEGDYSSASFLLAASAITRSHIIIENLNKASLQGDRAILKILEAMGIQMTVSSDFVEIHCHRGLLKPLDVDLKDNPDLVPVTAVLACFADGKSTIRGIRRLRIKESNRVTTLLSELKKLGVSISATDNMFVINGGTKIQGADLDSHKDHRIAMACVTAALGTKGTSVVRGVECINKSYPDFIKDITSLGGLIIEQ